MSLVGRDRMNRQRMSAIAFILHCRIRQVGDWSNVTDKCMFCAGDVNVVSVHAVKACGGGKV